MKPRSAIRKRRPGGPRRGRVVDKLYMAWMHETQRPLISFMAWEPALGDLPELHHVRKRVGDQKDDTRTVMLASSSHRIGPLAVEKIGDRGFQNLYELDFEAEIRRCNAQYERETGRALKSVKRGEQEA